MGTKKSHGSNYSWTTPPRHLKMRNWTSLNTVMHRNNMEMKISTSFKEENYDIFMRLMERMVARNMPFLENLYRAFLSNDTIEDFTLILTRMAGITDKPVRISSIQVVEEMSRVRHLHTRDYLRQNSRNVSPIHTVSQVQLKESENWTHILISLEEATRQTISQNIKKKKKKKNMGEKIKIFHKSIHKTPLNMRRHHIDMK
jgi:hypothetical protein